MKQIDEKNMELKGNWNLFKFIYWMLRMLICRQDLILKQNAKLYDKKLQITFYFGVFIVACIALNILHPNYNLST